MTSSADAKTIIRQLVNRINEAGTGDPYELLSEDVIVTINGTTPLSGRYPNLETAKGILVDTARRVVTDLRIGLTKIIGSNSTVACQLIIQGKTSGDRVFNAQGEACSCIFDVVNGLITEVALYPDTSAIEMALYGKRFVSNDE
jgi:ketosteroid isomerase-like protein